MSINTPNFPRFDHLLNDMSLQLSSFRLPTSDHITLMPITNLTPDIPRKNKKRNRHLKAFLQDVRISIERKFIKVSPTSLEISSPIIGSTRPPRITLEQMTNICHAAVYNDHNSQELTLAIHIDCMDSLHSPNTTYSYTKAERRLLRKGYLVLELFSHAHLELTTCHIAEEVRRYFFPTETDIDSRKRLPKSVFRSFIHHAVRKDELMMLSACQILLLATADDTDEESETERAIFDGTILRDLDACTQENETEIVEKPEDTALYDSLFTPEDLAEALATPVEFDARMERYTSELGEYIVGDRRLGALNRPAGAETRKSIRLLVKGERRSSVAKTERRHFGG